MTVLIPKMPEPSQSDIARLEAAVGGALPTDYLEFVRAHNGARPQSNSVPVGANNESSVRYFIAVADAPAVFGRVEGFPAAVVPLAEDDCGNFFYMNRVSSGIFFWDHEFDGGATEVAYDITEFLAALVPFDVSSVTLAPRQVKHAWIDPSFKPEFD